MHMNINIEMIQLLYDIFSSDKYNDELCDKLLSSKQVKDMIVHDIELGRDTTIEIIKNSIINTLNGINNDIDCYFFNNIKSNLTQVVSILKYINDNKNHFYETVCTRIERYVPKHCLNGCTYYIYCGYDYGFCQSPSEVYINITKLFTELDSLEDILTHEFYHARKRNIDMNELFTMNFSKETYLDTFLIYFLEEGIATLVQLEYEQKTYESGVLKKEHFDSKSKYMNLLSDCITEISINNNYSERLIFNFLNGFSSIYIIGYWIGQVLYKHGGKDYLNIWTLDHNHKKCIKLFIESLRKDAIPSGLSIEAENYILNYCLE